MRSPRATALLALLVLALALALAACGGDDGGAPSADDLSGIPVAGSTIGDPAASVRVEHFGDFQ